MSTIGTVLVLMRLLIYWFMRREYMKQVGEGWQYNCVRTFGTI
jgi:hypothetical protein